MSNVLLNAGSGGATLGTDTVTGTPNVDYQIAKIGFSVSGTAPVQVSASNPFPIAVNLSGTAASVNTGNADAGTQRVVLATNQPSIANAIPVTQSGAWTVSVNGVVADATAFTRGTTVQLPVGGVVEAVQSALTVGQTRALSLTAAALLRVDGSNVTQPVSGTFWQATQPISGTVTANQGTANTPANAWPTVGGIALTTLAAQGTALNSTQTIIANGSSGAEAVMVQLTQTSTLTAGAVTFEVTYDGTNWAAVPAAFVVDPTSTTYAQIAIPYTVQASTNKQFLILLNGATGLRIRTSTAITGTGTVTPNFALLNYQPLEQVSVLGTVLTVPNGVAPVDHADVSVAATTTDSTITANTARKAITICNLSANSGPIRVRLHASGVGGVEVLPGAFYNIQTTSALDIVNPNASSISYAWQEYQ